MKTVTLTMVAFGVTHSNVKDGLRMISRYLVLVLLALLVVGCSSNSDSSPDSSTNEQTITANDSVREQLQFSRVEDEQRFQCIYDQFIAVAQKDGLGSTDMQHFDRDGVVFKLWCDGQGDKDSISCQNPRFSGPLRNAGSRFMLLQTSVVDAFPNVAGTLEAFGQNPADDSESVWGIEFRRALSAGPSATDGVTINFTRVNDEGEFATQLNFGQSITHPLLPQPLALTLPGNTIDDFKQLSASPELFASTFEARYDELQFEVERQFASGEQIDDTGTVLTYALAYIDLKREEIRNNAPELHALLTSTVNALSCQ